MYIYIYIVYIYIYICISTVAFKTVVNRLFPLVWWLILVLIISVWGLWPLWVPMRTNTTHKCAHHNYRYMCNLDVHAWCLDLMAADDPSKIKNGTWPACQIHFWLWIQKVHQPESTCCICKGPQFCTRILPGCSSQEQWTSQKLFLVGPGESLVHNSPRNTHANIQCSYIDVYDCSYNDAQALHQNPPKRLWRLLVFLILNERRQIEIWIGGTGQNRGFQRGRYLIREVAPTIWEVYKFDVDDK